MADPVFRLVCLPSALSTVAPEWAQGMLGEGEIALLPGEGGLDAIGALAHRLSIVSVTLLRGEVSAGAQDDTVITFAGALPLVWIGASFSGRVGAWARSRGPMTLLVDTDGPLDDDERRRIERFVATLGRQSE
jgi:hypothetical protein